MVLKILCWRKRLANEAVTSASFQVSNFMVYFVLSPWQAEVRLAVHLQ